MDIKFAYVAFALGVAVGIVTALALANPILTAAFLIVCLAIIAVSAITVVKAKRRRQEAIKAFDSQSDAGLALRKRVFDEPVTLASDEDRAYWWEQVTAWDGETHKVIHEYADDWHQKYNTWPVSPGMYMTLKIWRSEVVTWLDARLEALAEIRTKS
jgi:hypothetical protein